MDFKTGAQYRLLGVHARNSRNAAGAVFMQLAFQSWCYLRWVANYASSLIALGGDCSWCSIIILAALDLSKILNLKWLVWIIRHCAAFWDVVMALAVVPCKQPSFLLLIPLILILWFNLASWLVQLLLQLLSIYVHWNLRLINAFGCLRGGIRSNTRSSIFTKTRYLVWSRLKFIIDSIWLCLLQQLLINIHYFRACPSWCMTANDHIAI